MPSSTRRNNPTKTADFRRRSRLQPRARASAEPLRRCNGATTAEDAAQLPPGRFTQFLNRSFTTSLLPAAVVRCWSSRTGHDAFEGAPIATHRGAMPLGYLSRCLGVGRTKPTGGVSAMGCGKRALRTCWLIRPVSSRSLQLIVMCDIEDICEQRTTPEQAALCHKSGPGGASTVRRPTWPGPDLEPSVKPYCLLLAPSKTKHGNRKDRISYPYRNRDTARAPALLQLVPTVRPTVRDAGEMT